MSSSTTSLGPSAHSYAGPSSSYSTAFPPLQSIPWNFQHHHHQYHSNQHYKKHSTHANHQSSLYQCLAPPKYPAYLKHTLYADLALEQYNYYQNKRSFFPSDHNHHHSNKNHWGITAAASSSTTDHDPMPTAAESSSSDSPSAKTHHGLPSASPLSSSSSSSSTSQYAWAEEIDLRLPTCWNQKAKSRHIEIGRNGLDLSYIGTLIVLGVGVWGYIV
ncbi:hypothetical protein BDB00DRAFT_540135 [Zychaea mexicana]|uniref:uncharacterized protein n=1 Tax=Zychaea mexicana TaxID=64656 RepID=UPI0022FE583E|nr:uncharacterized protein BDB00DRAFT_540135 [Zychaea mexicana]KAI9497797.1 hypothetical protein BDB00DRAFT_540135 [Zychaea mexicana]